jgi:MFS family permease
VTTVFGGLDVGSVLGLLLCGPLIHWFGWQSVFYLFAALGLLWCLAWPLVRPEYADADAPVQLQRAKAAAKAAKAAAAGTWLARLQSSAAQLLRLPRCLGTARRSTRGPPLACLPACLPGAERAALAAPPSPPQVMCPSRPRTCPGASSCALRPCGL